MNYLGKKIAFYSAALVVLVLKVYGLFAASLAWPLIIVLALIGVVTEPEAAR